MSDLIDGLYYQFRGLAFAFRDRRLLWWGLIRFVVTAIVAVLLAGWTLTYHEAIMNLIWLKPENFWILILWQLVSWTTAIIMILLSVFLAYLVSQILFSVLIMDYMSRLTERKIRGFVEEPGGSSIVKMAFYLISQEVPRAILPAVAAPAIMILGWIFPFTGPVMVVLSIAITAVFLAWDNTDLVPARRLLPFRERWQLLRSKLLFHLGFGLPFLIPVVNLLFLSFAPVGATLYYLEKQDLSWKTRSAKIVT
ncbi:MAG: EI24 domain-containing protein [Syntrophaceae bacterium]|nr:EI24 domain-containing protein [Syntrophaceae bacterium]